MSIRGSEKPILRKAVQLSVLLLLLGSLMQSNTGIAAPDAPRTIITVNTNADEFDVSGSGSGCSLREAIQTANTGLNFGGCVMDGSGAMAISIPAGTYQLSRHGYFEDLNETGDLDIKVTIDLYGADAGTTIIRGDDDAIEHDRVFHIVEDNESDYVVTMWDLSITGGNSGLSDGGGILNEESLWVSRVDIYNNETQASGGGVSSEPAHTGQGFRAYLNSSISNNSAASNVGGGIYLFDGQLLLDHVEITGNTAINGAGVFLVGDGATISWTNLYANIASGNGAGIYAAGEGLSLEDSGVYDNSTGGDGGNLFFASRSGTSRVVRCYIGGGQAASGAGAGIYTAADLYISSSTIALNTGDHAAGIYRASPATSGELLTIFDSTIANNNTALPGVLFGEGLYNAQNLTDITIRNSIFSGNGNSESDDDNCLSANPARLVSLGFNLDSGDSCGFSLGSDQADTDPLLGTLDYHNGFTLNYDLMSGSPALETGGACLATDQRGFSRPMDQDRDGIALCDIGAFEAEPYFLPPQAWFPLIKKP